ncbi:MAG TPA: hypothetical protein VK658_18200 [Chryseolinea sp.]|nr:hypothetical protein [Chryseolinea sp.]
MITASGKIRQTIVLVLIAIVAATLILLYLFIYVKDRENYVNKRNYRELSKSAENIKRKVQTYSSVPITSNFLQYNLDFVLNNHYDQAGSGKTHERLYQALVREINADHMKLSISAFSSHPFRNESTRTHSDSFTRKTQQSTPIIIRNTNDSSKLYFYDTLKACVYDDKLANCAREDDAGIAFYVESNISCYNFIRPLLSGGIFRHYLLFKQDTGALQLLYESYALGATDSIKSTVRSGRSELQLNGNTYKTFTFTFSIQNQNWILVGLQNNETYIAETRNFDRWLLYTFILCSLIILLALPWLKVLLISNNEKLNRIDVILSAVSLLFACILWTIILVAFDYDRLYRENDAGDSSLTELAAQIETAFQREITVAHDALKRADHAISPQDTKVQFRNDSVFSKADDKTFAFPTTYQTFDFIFWMDAAGQQKVKWSTISKPTRKIPVSSRDYFRKAKQRAGWPLNANDTVVIQSIRSWNNAGERAVISWVSNSPGMAVVAIQSKLSSVINCILPPGYTFCLADKEGNVLFHEDPARNLNENIFDECNIKYDINKILYSEERISKVTYHNKQHALHIQPLSQFPLFLITMKDLSVEAQSKAFVIEATSVLVVIHILLILVTMLLIWLTWRKTKRRFAIRTGSEWLKPHEAKSKLYTRILLLNLMVSILLVPFFSTRPTDEIIIFLLTPLYILPIYYLSLNSQRFSQLLNPLNRGLLAVMVILILIVNFLLFRFEPGWPVLWYQVILTLLIVYWYSDLERSSRSLFKNVDKIHRTSSLSTSYSLALSSLFLVVAIIPAFEFQRQSFNLERLKYALAMISETAKRVAESSTDTKVYTLSAPTKADSDLPKDTQQEWQSATDIDYHIRLLATMLDTSAVSFLKRGDQWHVLVGDRAWTWRKIGNSISFAPISNAGEHKTMARFDVNLYHFPGFLRWLIAAVGVVCLFFFSRHLVTRIFIFDVNRNLVEADLFLITADNGGLSKEVKTRAHLLENHLFIVGLPLSGKRDYVDRVYPPDPAKRYVIDMVNIDHFWSALLPFEAQEAELDVIIIDHFEFDFQSAQRNNNKLQLLEYLFQKWKAKVVILSTIQPSQILEHHVAGARNATRWNAVFSQFYVIFYPLEKAPFSKEDIMHQFRIDDAAWQQNHLYYEFIEQECGHGLFLQNLRPTLYSLLKVANTEKITVEELSEKIRSLAHTYYTAVWASCSKDERFLIYDLAEDGLVNNNNAQSIIHLIYKGIFNNRRTLTIMNRSFRNFVVSRALTEEVQALRKETSHHGTWSRIKGPIVLILIIGLLFLLYTQKGLANEIMAFLGVLIAAVPALLKSMASIDLPSQPRQRQT